MREGWWKLVLLGGLAFYAVTFVLSFATGAVVHNNLLQDTYRETAEFWRPELTRDPPDMAALMPRWVLTGLLTSFVLAGMYGWLRPAFRGPGWRKGLAFGVVLSVFGGLFMLGVSGVFNLPSRIWNTWTAESFVLNLPGGAVLGWLAQKLAPETR